MPKNRVPIPRLLRERILAEFNHRCAICGADKPQIHHIDENPTNNHEDNLIPLCPNCHLVDQHNPTAPVEPLKLRIFRRYKDPLILSPQFHPLFLRFSYLFGVETTFDFEAARTAAIELVAFINALRMGGFYHARFHALIGFSNLGPTISFMHEPAHVIEARHQAQEKTAKATMLENRERAVELIVEMLRYQDWSVPRQAVASSRGSSPVLPPDTR
jgi:hypothetical protein